MMARHKPPRHAVGFSALRFECPALPAPAGRESLVGMGIVAAAAGKHGRRGWRYLLGFALQAIGTITLIVTALPRYRGILRDPTQLSEPVSNLKMALELILLSQVGYWMSRPIPPPAPALGMPVLGQVIRFFGRLMFMFVTSVFGFLFITRSHGIEMPSTRAAMFVLGLFAIYCFTDQVEQLGQAVSRGRVPKG